jgi:hypothetical protein
MAAGERRDLGACNRMSDQMNPPDATLVEEPKDILGQRRLVISAFRHVGLAMTSPRQRDHMKVPREKSREVRIDPCCVSGPGKQQNRVAPAAIIQVVKTCFARSPDEARSRLACPRGNRGARPHRECQEEQNRLQTPDQNHPDLFAPRL